MRTKIVKLTLEDLLEVLLSHGIKLQKIEAIMASLGIPQRCTERVLASVIMTLPQKGMKDASGLKERGLGDEAELTMQNKMDERINRKLVTDQS